MTFLLRDPAPGPGTHAIVIGAAKYEPSSWQLSNLDPAIHSARAMSAWLMAEARHPAAMPHAPLKSVELLISSPTGPITINDVNDKPVIIEAATMMNLERAVQRWFDLGNQDYGSQMIFYFCGHGLQKGLSKYLLLEGFADPLALSVAGDAIDFDAFALGMERCRARRQIYFLDCCRSISDKALSIPTTLGKALVDPDYSLVANAVPRDWPVYCAAAGGQQAFGANGQPSRFTSALLKALRGCAWNLRGNCRQVAADSLATYVDQLLKFEEAARFVPAQSARRAGESVDFPLFEAPPGANPVPLPVLIGCTDATELSGTSFTVTGTGIPTKQRLPKNEEWELELPEGATYILDAQNAGVKKSLPFGVCPACQIVRI